MAIVALDIETTGLDHQKDAILEIGAVRFNGRRVEADWSSLVNPGRPIPPFITQLTGITNQMVAQAPPIRAILPDLSAFVGDDPVLGHNIGFDLSFLQRYGLLGLNDQLDTYEMAAILLPTASRYNLGALAQALAVPLPATHRALDDAMVTHGIYIRLLDRASDLPVDLLAELVRTGERLDWKGYWPFREALKLRSRQAVKPRQPTRSKLGPLWSREPGRAPAPLQPRREPQELDPEEVAALLEHGGAFSRLFPNFEYRSEQVEMLKVVTQALSKGRHLMVEAGTGVGKSMAYLVPAAVWATRNNTRVVVSTNTINLQDQLIHKDIPDARAALGLDALRASVMKGRSNYLCPRRFELLRRRGPDSADEMRILGKVMVWLLDSASGDRGEINLNGPVEREVWWSISAEDEGCTTEICLERTGGSCPFYKARQEAQAAHLLIVNHALLLADVATGNRLIPEYDHLIVDEAHHLEDATTNALSFRSNPYEIERLIGLLGSPNSGLLGWLLSTLKDILPPSDFAAINRHVQRATDLAFQFQHLSRIFYQAIEAFLGEQRNGRPVGPYGHQERILPATRTQPAWSEVEIAWDEASQILKPLLEEMAQIGQALADLNDVLPEEGMDLYNQLTSLFRRLNELLENINALVFRPGPDKVYWAFIQSDERRLSLHAAPLHIGPLMEQHLWHEKSSVILTSATLTAAGEFDYIRGRLSADEADEVALGSPFDYESSTLLYIANDIPEPGDRIGYQRALERGLISLCQATGGRALVLFTSYAQLRATAQVITPALMDKDILVYEQGEGASPHTLLETFRTSERAVLLGTRAFWEGVDVPGEALSVLVIAKLPFDVPTDPIIAARAETFEDPFNHYQLPEAILRFRQGFGRLIRSHSDRGVVAILDRRVLTKRYGRAFLDSLPTCTVRIGPLGNLPRTAERWLSL